MVGEIKANSLENTVVKLVSFGTRHTLSDTKKVKHVVLPLKLG
jgi:hypothetical protein